MVKWLMRWTLDLKAARIFFETGDWNQIATIRHKFREWFDPNYSGDLGF